MRSSPQFLAAVYLEYETSTTELHNMEQTDGLIGLPNIRQIYAQEPVQQLRHHIGAVISNGGYIGELQMIGRGPVGTTPLKPEHLLHPSGDSHNSAQTFLRALQKRTPKLKSPVEMTEETASNKEKAAKGSCST